LYEKILVNAALEKSVLILNEAERALQSTADDLKKMIEEGYAKEMVGDELTTVQKTCDRIDSILNQFDGTRIKFNQVLRDFRRATAR